MFSTQICLFDSTENKNGFMIVFIDCHTHNLNPKNPFSIVNLTPENAKDVLQTSDHLFFSVGLHPWYVHENCPTIIRTIEDVISDERVKAIGECGLDRNSKASLKEQSYFFERQVMLSEKYEKPVLIHCVSAFNELILLRKRLKPTQNWVVHGFRGKPEMASQLLKHGFVISYGKKLNMQSVEITPIDKLCIETDDSSTPVEEIFKQIAAIKNCSPNELNAACQLFKLYVC